MKQNSFYACEGCGFKVFTSDYQICPICNYENSYSGILDPFTSDANGGLTLIDYQKWTLDNIGINIKEYKKGKNIFYRDNNWRVIDINNFNRNYDYYPKYFFDTIIKSDTSFYKKQLKIFQEAQKYNADERVHLEL